jgi:TolB-like protein
VATASEIAYKVGFNSPSYFNKVFKNYFQVSPGDVRKGVAPVPSSPEAVQQTLSETVPQKRIHTKWAFLILALVLPGIAITGMYFLFHEEKPVEKSIAILPFDNLSSSNENQYFADGIVEDLLNRLSRVDGLKVISRTSSEMFRDKGSKTIPEIAELLGVSYILEGTVQQETNIVRINIQLIDAKKDNHILSKQYDRDLSEVFKIQSEIAGQIASELSFVLTEKQLDALKQDKTRNLKAFEYYQMGRFHSSKRWIEGYTKSIEYYEKAIAEDSDYALAYAGLSDTYHLMALQGWMDFKEGRKKSTELALKALELDPYLAEPHAVLGDFYVYADRNWEKGEKELLQAIKLNPNFSTAHQYYSELLTTYGRFDKAREHINKALELDPFSFVIRNFSAEYYYNNEQFNEALAENNICLDLANDHPWALNLAFDIYLHMDSIPAALEIAKKFAGQPGQPTAVQIDSIYATEGINGLTRWVIRHTKWEHEYYAAIYYAMLGEKEKTLELLEAAAEANALGISTARLEYKNLRHHPRFIAIRKKMGLPPL